jgi:hypothetical protein
MSSGDMPDAVIVIVGEPAGAGVVGVVGAVVVTGSVGAVGADDVDPPEQAAINRTANSKKMRSTALFSPAAQPDLAIVTGTGTLTSRFAAISAIHAGPHLRLS